MFDLTQARNKNRLVDFNFVTIRPTKLFIKYTMGQMQSEDHEFRICKRDQFVESVWDTKVHQMIVIEDIYFFWFLCDLVLYV